MVSHKGWHPFHPPPPSLKVREWEGSVYVRRVNSTHTDFTRYPTPLPPGLGAGTIVGGAAFNLFPILAVCVLIPRQGALKRIESYGVFVVELVWSLWAYVWLIVILKVHLPASIVCLFVCLFIHVFMYLCIHVFMYSCIHVFMYSCTHVFMYSIFYFIFIIIPFIF